MATLKRLIEHQRIRIDAHEAGTGQAVNASGLHIDKTFTEKRLRGKRLKINLHSGEIDAGSLDERDLRRVKSEIRDVLKKNKNVLRQFGETIAEELNRWSSGKIEVEAAKASASAIAKKLGLKPEIEEEMVRRVHGRLTELVTIHQDEKNKPHWLQFTASSFAAGPGVVRVFKGWDETSPAKKG